VTRQETPWVARVAFGRREDFEAGVERLVGPGRVVVVTSIAEREAPPAVPDHPPSFDEVYAAHYGDLTVQLYAYFNDRQEAQDIAQEAFCRALARWDAVSGYDDPVAWVRRVAWNLAVSRWRRSRTVLGFLRRQRRDEPYLEGPAPDRVALFAALAKLPDRQRRLVVLRYLADLTVAEIAEREGIAEGTVKSMLHRARTTLAAEVHHV
jgi:RNA polymerase sigma-70 factor, ECF subfamily